MDYLARIDGAEAQQHFQHLHGAPLSFDGEWLFGASVSALQQAMKEREAWIISEIYCLFPDTESMVVLARFASALPNPYREIVLTKNQTTIVSLEDYYYLTQFKWCALESKSYGRDGVYFAITRQGAKTHYMQRVVLARVLGRELTSSEIADHINGDDLDNRRENLRAADAQQSQRNRGVPKNNTSGYKGVTYDKKKGKWLVQIMAGDKSQRRLGYFDTAEEAAQVYNTAAIELHGEYARLNQIEQVEGI